MAMQVGERGSLNAEPNVVPMIDIMLVLLIIFMIVTPVIASGFTAKMPLAKEIETRSDEPEDIVLGIDADGAFYLTLPEEPDKIGLVPGCSPTSPDYVAAACHQRLEEWLAQIYRARTKDKILYFKADKDLEFATVQEAIEIARNAGVRVIAAITEELREEGGGLFGGR